MLTGILVPIASLAAIFAIIYIVVSARNRERMAMIDKGVNPKDFLVQKKVSVYSVLKWALLLVGLGLGLFLASLFDTYTSIPQEPVYFACSLFFGGLGLTAAFIITKNAETDN